MTVQLERDLYYGVFRILNDIHVHTDCFAHTFDNDITFLFLLMFKYYLKTSANTLDYVCNLYVSC